MYFQLVPPRLSTECFYLSYWALSFLGFQFDFFQGFCIFMNSSFISCIVFLTSSAVYLYPLWIHSGAYIPLQFHWLF
jgi:hypothetical protein